MPLSRRDRIFAVLDGLVETDRRPRPCSIEEHDAIKASPTRWRAETVPLERAGHLRGAAGDLLELRNCVCGSTLARPLARGPLEVSP